MAPSDRSVHRRDILRGFAAAGVSAACSSWVDAVTLLAQEHAQTHPVKAAGAAATWTPRVLVGWRNDAVIALTERIIPATDTPGAKGALVNRFIDRVLVDARPADRDKFLAGLTWMNDRSRELFGHDLQAASVEEHTALLTRVSDEHDSCAEAPIGCEFFRAIKAMTISGYYSSEIGLRQELGDDGQLYLQEFAGCTHPEHQP